MDNVVTAGFTQIASETMIVAGFALAGGLACFVFTQGIKTGKSVWQVITGQ